MDSLNSMITNKRGIIMDIREIITKTLKTKMNSKENLDKNQKIRTKTKVKTQETKKMIDNLLIRRYASKNIKTGQDHMIEGHKHLLSELTDT
jgi:hypothetical protein